MIKAKKGNRYTSKSLFIGVFVFALVSFAVYTTLRITQSEQESKYFSQTKIIMEKLRTDFDLMDQGWQYSESCEGAGGVYEADIPSSCELSISNSQLNLDHNEAWQKVLSYKDIVEKQSRFSITNTDSRESEKAVVFRVEEMPEGYCTLEPINTNDSYGLIFVCRHPANKFYFPRSDV